MPENTEISIDTLDQLIKERTEGDKEICLNGDNCFLGITTNEDAVIYVNGKEAGKTEGKYVSFGEMKPGRYTIEARNKYKSGSFDILLTEHCVERKDEDRKKGRRNP
ncbi:MAG: hypothetical protein HQK89_14420 [Nitrospirae bacterium]|nr:hypothetical protein [Nitrospirota bacterium]